MKNIGTWKDAPLAAKLLQEGEVVTFPTETVYGVGVVFDSESAFKDLVALKKRPPNKPFSMMCDSLARAEPYLDIGSKERKTLAFFLPGELTFLLKAKKNLPSFVTLGTNVLGLRVPANEEVTSMLSMVGKPCLVTSANISGEPTAKTFEELDSSFLDKTFVIRGECVSHLASTIVDLTGNEPLLIRQGKVPFSDIVSYWNSLSD